MNYHILHDNPDDILQQKLSAFETQFHYPLGKDHWFSISHCNFYLNFYLAMGPATCIVAENNEGVQGTICSAIRTLYNPNTKATQEVAYIGDLKVALKSQGKGMTYELMQQLQASYKGPAIPVMSVVMDGTKLTPFDYTGKKGFLTLEIIQKVYVIQLLARKEGHSQDVSIIGAKKGVELFEQMHCHSYFLPKQLNLRAKNGYQWIHVNDKACAVFENTRLAKRLYKNNGEEIKNAHLSYLSYKEDSALLIILKQALHMAFESKYQAVFLALSEAEYLKMNPILEQLPVVNVAKATVYGTPDLKTTMYNINTAEI
tara:strand:- start:10972 stop:11916 length:945 start_codon:yes stop_codon:yes gene_type:complete